jgi:hypothetical protein
MAALAVIPGLERSEGTRNPVSTAGDYGFRARAFGAPRNDGGSIQREWKLLNNAGQTARGYGGALFGTAARR